MLLVEASHCLWSAYYTVDKYGLMPGLPLRGVVVFSQTVNLLGMFLNDFGWSQQHGENVYNSIHHL